MAIDIQLFGRLREIAGARTIRVALPRAPIDAADLKALIAAERPDLAPYLAAVAVCAGDALVGPGEPLPALTGLALLPPVSGG
jgi:molybdopterin converting factor small subunit